MARTKSSVFYKWGASSLMLALVLWLAANRLTHWTAVYYVTIISSASTSDDVMQDVLSKAVEKTGIESFLYPRRARKSPGEVMLIVPAPNANLGKDRTTALFSAMESDLAKRGKSALKRTGPVEPQSIPPFYLREFIDAGSFSAQGFGLLAVALILFGYYRTTGAQPPPLEIKTPEPPAPAKKEFDY